jgi:uncharacterized iron-regulated protein
MPPMAALLACTEPAYVGTHATSSATHSRCSRDTYSDVRHAFYFDAMDTAPSHQLTMHDRLIH